jgi:hypothetical protein
MTAARKAFLPILLFALVVLLRLPLLQGPGLWADEFFSLALATGHSLEHPAANAVPSLGDFVESREALPAGTWGRYLEQEDPPAGSSRVVRAVFMSDTSPPLYYILLDYWIRVMGAGDTPLRLFSVVWAVATVLVLWPLGCRLGGTTTAAFAVILYASAPASLYYSGEGRMYSMFWFLATGFAWLTLVLHDRGVTPTRITLWCLCAVAGLLTHYFFTFVWAGCVVWLLLYPGRAYRGSLVGAACAICLLAMPWYLRVPESLARWRVTGDWLEGTIGARDAVLNPLKLGWSLLSGRGMWGGSRPLNLVAQALFVLIALAAVFRYRRPLLRPRSRLVWLWVAGAIIGPVALDLLRGTSASTIFRYALGALPAAMLLAALALSRLDRRVGVVLIGLVLVAWTPGIKVVLTHGSRYRAAYRDAARTAQRWAGPADLVIVHSIPSGVLGVARYLPPKTSVAAWVGQLGQRRVPEDIRELVGGRRRVVLVRIHAVGAPAPEEAWLREHSRIVADVSEEDATIVAFEPTSGTAFTLPDCASRGELRSSTSQGRGCFAARPLQADLQRRLRGAGTPISSE